jgi:L-seryl-tRNA(Ser) seleniumtransferase
MGNIFNHFKGAEKWQMRISKVPAVSIYQQLGVKRVINCVSTTSPLGSSVVDPQVMNMMTAASRHFVALDDLQNKVGAEIATITKTESAIVTSGCAAALTMATAACLMKNTPLETYRLSPNRPPTEVGDWLTWMQRLPDDTAGLRNEILLQRGHLNMYSQAHRAAGAQLTIAGTATACLRSELEAQVTSRTAAIAFVGMYAHHGLPFPEVVALAQRHELPIIVDASYTLPPRSNLQYWATAGADLVCYSGGKAIRGPTDTGILCGRKDLITLAAIQMSPHHGIGRGLKVDKTQIIGLLTALKLFIAQDDEVEFQFLKNKAQYILQELTNLPEIQSIELVVPTTGYMRHRPVLCLQLNESQLQITSQQLVELLYSSTPAIWTYYDHPLCPRGITMNTQNLLEGEALIVVKRIKTLLHRNRITS